MQARDLNVTKEILELSLYFSLLLFTLLPFEALIQCRMFFRA